MSQKTKKIGVTALVLAVAFGVLLSQSLGESLQQYKYVDEVMASPAQWEGKNLKLHGYVKPGTITRKRDTLEYRFDMQRNGQIVTAYFEGIPPDTFKDDSEVVLTGVMTGQGFHATEMTAKCPSKYEERPTASGL